MTRFLKNLNPGDIAFIVYQAIILILVTLFHNDLNGWPIFLFCHSMAIAASVGIVFYFGDSEKPLFRFIRHWYVILTYALLFVETGLLNQLVFKEFWDDAFRNADLMLFGRDPNIWLYEHWNNFWINEFFHLCYFSYYVIPILFGALLFSSRNANFFRMLFGITLTFYICYLCYLVIPVRGPLEDRIGRFLNGGPFVVFMDWLYEHAEKPGAAFPSSHVAIALLVLFYSYRYRRDLFLWFLPFILGLVVSTAYCFYHYVVDVFAGIALAIGMFYFCEAWYNKTIFKYFPEKL